MPSLADVFWNHVDQRLSAKQRGRTELERELNRLHRGRNKNTYTKWFNERPDVRLSDVEDVAIALSVPVATLISPELPNSPSSAIQLELPFTADLRRVSFELEASESALKLRITRS